MARALLRDVEPCAGVHAARGRKREEENAAGLVGEIQSIGRVVEDAADGVEHALDRERDRDRRRQDTRGDPEEEWAGLVEERWVIGAPRGAVEGDFRQCERDVARVDAGVLGGAFDVHE